MTFENFKTAIAADLKANPTGKVWSRLKEDLRLPYQRPCPEWTRRLEKDLGLVREKGAGRELVWKLRSKQAGSR